MKSNGQREVFNPSVENIYEALEALDEVLN
jgi:hypothetical protein